MPIDKKLLRETLQLIKDNPQHWDQSSWHCGSSHCFAGFVECKVRGMDFAEKITDNYLAGFLSQDANELIQLLNLDAGNSDDLLESYCWRSNCYLIARFALGINGLQADELFHADNTLESLERIVEELCAINN